MMIAAKLSVPHKVFRAVAAGADPKAVLRAMQRALCVATGNVLKTEWFTSIPEHAVMKLVSGKWTVGSTGPTTLDLWNNLVRDIYLCKRGRHALNNITRCRNSSHA